MMHLTDEGTVEKGCAGLGRVDDGRISAAGTLRNGAIVHHGGAGL
jgi:hypothetical protein